jgi:hypothetical protein
MGKIPVPVPPAVIAAAETRIKRDPRTLCWSQWRRSDSSPAVFTCRTVLVPRRLLAHFLADGTTCDRNGNAC